MATKKTALVHLSWGAPAKLGLNDDGSFHMDLTGTCSGEVTGTVEASVDGFCTLLVENWPHAGRETVTIKIATDDGKTINLEPVPIIWDTFAKTPPPYCGWFTWQDHVGHWGAFPMKDGIRFNNTLTIDIPIG